ncbi:SpoIIE family protein phosphatase [Amedibacillus sp. YH-ame10]
MEKAIHRKVKGRFALRTSDVYCAGLAILVGSISSPLAYALALLFITYTYVRSSREVGISIFFVVVSALVRGVLPAYFYALGFAVYFVIIHVLKLRNKNLYQWLPYVACIITLAYSFQSYQFTVKTIVMPLMSFVVMQQMFQDCRWVKKEFMLSREIIAVLIFALALSMGVLFPAYEEVLYLVALLNICFISDTMTSIALMLVSFYLLPIQNEKILLLAAALAVFKQQRKNAVCIIIGALFLLPKGFEDYLYIAIAAIGLFMYPQKQQDQRLVEHSPISNHNVIKRQMNNYAGIFQLLSEYYAQMNDVQSELLLNMANALQYNADIIRKVEGNEKDSAYITKALEGYQYEVKELFIEEPKEGCLQINLELSNIKRGEIRTTLLPLLEVLLHRKLEIEEVHSHRFQSGAHRILIGDKIPFVIDAYADSIKNAYTSNGDTFSIFRFRQSVICMISDGMGNGERAMKSSRLITSIFQRMMISGISQDQAIRCINKLVQSDTFATLDVLCFNKAQGVVYISKSAACPTFLLRKSQVYEINGNALPVGIISQMQPDCFQITCEIEDEYLMVSDGVTIEEIQEWMKKRKRGTVKEDIEIFSEVLRRTQRKDDSTVILARVDEM